MKRCSRCSAPHNRSHAWCAGCHAAYMRQWRRGRPLTAAQATKDLARSTASNAKKAGILVPQPCIDCGVDPEDEPVEMFHGGDYTDPLKIEWLCTGCRLQRPVAQTEQAQYRPAR